MVCCGVVLRARFGVLPFGAGARVRVRGWHDRCRFADLKSEDFFSVAMLVDWSAGTCPCVEMEI